MKLLSLTFAIALLLLGAPAMALDACNPETQHQYQPISERYVRGVLFRINSCGNPPSYLFGTVHSDDPALVPIAAGVLSKIKQADGAGFEFVEGAEDAVVSQKMMFLDMGGNPGGLPELLGTERFEKLAGLVQQMAGLPGSVTARLKPWAAAILLQYPQNVGDGVILDKRLQNLAVQTKTPIYGLESLEEQLALFDNLPQDKQLTMLVSTIDDYAAIEVMNRRLLNAYKKEDLHEVEQLGNDSIESIEDPALRNFMTVNLLTDRNHRMFTRLLPKLQKSSQVIAIGALHLVGEEGLLALLEQEGYFVEAIAN